MRIGLQAVLVMVLVSVSMSSMAAEAFNENWYKRVYSGLDKPVVNQLIQSLFEKEGYTVIPVRPNGNVVATEWLPAEPEGLKDGWQEQRRFRSFIYNYTMEDKTAVLVVDLIKEQRASEQAAWKNKRIDFYNDRYYRGILEQLDKRVIAAGGQAKSMGE